MIFHRSTNRVAITKPNKSQQKSKWWINYIHVLHEHHYDQPLKTQVTYFESMMMVLLGSINKKEKRKKWDDTSSIPPMENEVGTMYNLNMEESAGGRSSSYVSGAKGLVGICTQGSVLGPILFVLQTQPLWRSVHHHSSHPSFSDNQLYTARHHGCMIHIA